MGENIVIGAYREDTGAENAGAVYVFDRQGTLLTTIHNPTPQADDWFGFEVRGVEDKILIAAENDSTGGDDSGSVYLFDTNGTLLTTIENPTPAENDGFGTRVLSFDDKILVTAWKDDTLALDAGAVYLFDQQGNLIREFFSPLPEPRARFGRTIATVGDDKVLISAYREDVGGFRNSGAAYLFDLDGNLLQEYLNPTPNDRDFFSIGLAAIGEDRVVITAIEDPPNERGGVAYIYDPEGNLEQTIPNPTPAVQDWFGRRITSVGEDRFLIGASFDDTAGLHNAGAAYLYDRDGELVDTFLPLDPSIEGHFSAGIATFDDLILIGSHFDGGGFTGPGAVYVYAPATPIPGDYNGDSIVDQADLDLVLLNWGAGGSPPPDGWVSNAPTGLIDQAELDAVLLNWGTSRESRSARATIPEPHTLLLLLTAVVALAGWRKTVRRPPRRD